MQIDPAIFGAIYGTGLSVAQYTANSDAFEQAQQLACTPNSGLSVVISGKLGLIRSPRQRDCPLIAAVPFSWNYDTLDGADGCCLFDGGVPDNTTFYRHGEYDMRHRLEHSLISGLGFYSANPKVTVFEVRSNTVSTSNADGSAGYVNRAMNLYNITVVHAGAGIVWGPNKWRGTAWAANRHYSMHEYVDMGGRAYRCIGSGASGSAAPVFPSVEFATVVDGSTRVARANLTAYVVGDMRSDASGARALLCVKAGTTAAAEPGGVAATARANLTAYQLGDIRTTGGGTRWWRCTIAGTSAAAEPGAMATAALGDFVGDGATAGTVSAAQWLRIIPRHQFVYDGTVKWMVLDWAVWEDRGPSSLATVPLRTNSTVYAPGAYIRVGRGRWVCTTGGTSAAAEPTGYRGVTRFGQTFGVTRGDTVTDGTAVFTQNGEAYIDSWEEQCDAPVITQFQTVGIGGAQTVSFLCSGANAADGAIVNAGHCNNGCQNGEAMVILDGGNWDIRGWYGGGDGTGTKIFARNLTNIGIEWFFCQSEKFQMTFDVPPNAPQAATYPVVFRQSNFDDDVTLHVSRRIEFHNSTLGSGGVAGEPARLRIQQGGRIKGSGNNFAGTDRQVQSMTDSFAFISMDMERDDMGSLAVGIFNQNERVRPVGAWAVGQPTFLGVTTEGRTSTTTRANTTAYAVGQVAKNAGGTHVFVCKIAGTSAAAQPGGMAAPTIGLDYVDGSVLWSCVNTVAVLTNGAVL